MILVCRDEISTRPAGTDFTLRLYSEIKFHSSKEGKLCPGKAEPLQYKRRIPSCLDEIFHMYDIIYKEFITLPGSRQNETEFHPG